MNNFRVFLAGQALSQSGAWLQLVSLAWLVVETTGSGAALGWLAAVTFGPLLVLGPLAGAFADRVDKHHLLIATQLLLVGQSAVLGAAILAGATGVAVLYGMALVIGLLHAVENPCRRAFLAETVGQERISRAVGLNGAVTAAGRVLGPISAGALIAWAEIGWSFIATAFAYAAAVSALLLIRRSALHVGEPARERGAVRAGLRYVWSVSELRLALVLTAVVATFGFNHQVLIPLLAERTFAGGAGAYTLLYTALGVGSVVGALCVTHRDGVDLRFLAVTVTAFAVANGLLALSPNLALAVPACAVTGVAASLFLTGALALLQRRCASAMRGRVMALSAMVVLGGLPVGGPIVGSICDVAGPRAGVAVGSLAALLATAFVLRRIRVEESSLIRAS